jgi:hypothetical protein
VAASTDCQRFTKPPPVCRGDALPRTPSCRPESNLQRDQNELNHSTVQTVCAARRSRAKPSAPTLTIFVLSWRATPRARCCGATESGVRRRFIGGGTTRLCRAAMRWRVATPGRRRVRLNCAISHCFVGPMGLCIFKARTLSIKQQPIGPRQDSFCGFTNRTRYALV